MNKPLIIDLGPHFEARWKRAPLRLRREIMTELRELYRFLEDEDFPVLDASPAPAPRVPEQTALPGLQRPPKPDLTPRPDNPFLPSSVLARLQNSQAQATAQLQELMQQRQPEAPRPDARVLEQQLRYRLGPVVETLIEEHMQGLKAELRFRLRAEMEKLIAEAVKKP